MAFILSWLYKKVHAWLLSIVLAVLASGPIPKHVAFVMDGNRRYARRKQQRIFQGHSEGFNTLHRMLEVCLKLNVRCVSAYAFAIENFKRSPEEVDALMHLAEEKLHEICQHGALLDKYGVRLNVLGNRGLLPQYVQDAAQEAEDMTRHNNRAIFNMCMPYAGRDDITHAIETAVRLSLESNEEITENDISQHTMTAEVGSPPLDILIRTSGVKRLSDYMLWQCCDDTQIQFCNTYWPDFGLWDFIPILLDYQRKAGLAHIKL